MTKIPLTAQIPKLADSLLFSLRLRFLTLKMQELGVGVFIGNVGLCLRNTKKFTPIR